MHELITMRLESLKVQAHYKHQPKVKKQQSPEKLAKDALVDRYESYKQERFERKTKNRYEVEKWLKKNRPMTGARSAKPKDEFNDETAIKQAEKSINELLMNKVSKK